MEQEGIQKAALNGLELLERATHTITGYDFKTFYRRADALLSAIKDGTLVVLEASEYQRLLENQKPERKKAAK